MTDVKSIYDMILSGQPGGGYSGIYKPSGPVMLPPQGMGSNQALGRLLSDPTGPGPDSGALSGMLDDPIYSGAAPYSGQQTMPHANGTQVASKDQSRLGSSPPGNLFAYGSMNQTPAQKAISIATGNADMNWEDANPAAMAPGQSDPWSGMRVGGGEATPGMVTGNTGRNIASYLPAGSPISGLFTGGLGGMFGNTPIGKLMSGLGALNPPRTGGGLAALGPEPGARFLQQQGQNTQGLTPGEVANNLKAAMGSHTRGSFGV